jgi:hypothetical protein
MAWTTAAGTPASCIKLVAVCLSEWNDNALGARRASRPSAVFLRGLLGPEPGLG